MTAASRLTALRHLLRDRGLAGWIVPHADEFQSEYLPPSAEALAWLTGFTGSAGLAIVTHDQAALFVDGRYTVQVERECDPALYSFHHLIHEPPLRWLRQQESLLGRDGQAAIGFDPALHPAETIDRWQEALRDSLRESSGHQGVSLVPIADNPLFALWQDRPPAPSAPLERYPDAYAGESLSERLDRVQDELRAAGQDAAVLTSPESVAWLLNLRGRDVPFTPVVLAPALVLAGSTANGTAADGAEVFLALPEARLPADFFAQFPPGSPRVRAVPLADLFAALPPVATVRLDRLTASWALRQQAIAAGAVVQIGEDPCALLRACKTPVQQDGMRQAHLLDGIALCRFGAWLDRQHDGSSVSPLTELDAAAALERLRRDCPDCRDLSFATIVGSGPHGAIVHYRADAHSNRALGDGELFLVDSGGQYWQGTTDVTRTFALGPQRAPWVWPLEQWPEPHKDMRRRYTQVLRGHLALSRAVFPTGTTGSQLDVLARFFLWQDGVDYDHGTGHGVGSYLSVHEGPQRISKVASPVALRPGMVLSNEPGYYQAGAYGIRIENLLMVVPAAEKSGERAGMLAFETLTLAPYQRELIAVEVLCDEERQWIDRYHQRVWASLSPHLSDQDRQWLAERTAPL